MATREEHRAKLSQSESINNPYGFSPYDATGIAEGFIECDDEEKQIAAWQFLHDTRLAYQLQGWFGRTAQHLLAQGTIS